MNEKNPNIVVEPEGMAYGISEFVTGKPLSDSEMVPDSHGVWPVSPLGFLRDTHGDALSDGGSTTGFVPYYSGDKTPEDMYTESYKLEGPYSGLSGMYASFPVASLSVSGVSYYAVTVEGRVPGAQEVIFVNSTGDDYTVTGLASEYGSASPVTLAVESASYSDGRTSLVLEIPEGTEFRGVVGEGKLDMCVPMGNTYDVPPDFVYVHGNASPAENGIFVPGTSRGDSWRKVCDYDPHPVPDAARECRTVRGYSDSEVAGSVGRSLGGMYDYGLHPAPDRYDLEGAGAFVNWFVNSGDVDVSGGAGRNRVPVPGFGLGAPGAGMTMERSTAGQASGDAASKRQITFGYGTKYDAYDVDSSMEALPLDWPFTGHTPYGDSGKENSITLSRQGVDFAVPGGGTVNVGALEREVHDSCRRCSARGRVPALPGEAGAVQCEYCSGTGEEDGQRCHGCAGMGYVRTCPDCGGAGHSSALSRVVMNRVHVCLYNDFSPSDGTAAHDGGAAPDTGSTVLKKTFVNLAAPITTKDGDDFEITVSLPNVNTDRAFSGDGTTDRKNLSAYYAYVSQPRVFVVSGEWEFSPTKAGFTLSGDRRTVTLATPFLDVDGNGLKSTGIRAKLKFTGVRKSVEVHGMLDMTGEVLTLDSPVEGIPAAAVSGTACGAAYVPANNATLDSSTAVGLNHARTEDGGLGPDRGSGTGLEEFNRFYAAGGSVGRHGAVSAGKDDLVVATVYPTATGTFPWSTVHRRKLSTLHRRMTIDGDLGTDSLLAAVSEMNRRIVTRSAFSAIPGYDGKSLNATEYPLSFKKSRGQIKAAYGNHRNWISYIGAVLSVDGTGATASSPVAQATRAVRMLSGDYRAARVRYGSLGSGMKMRAAGSPVDASWNLGTLVSMPSGEGGSLADEAVRIRLRHLPEYLASAGTSAQGDPVSPFLGLYPYVDETDPDRYSYYYGNPYGYGELSTTGLREEPSCGVTGGKERAFAVENSIVRAMAASRPNWFHSTDAYLDLLRSAEADAVNLSDMQYSTRSDVYNPHGLRDGMPWLEARAALTKMASPDGIPCPAVESYDGDIDEGQEPFLTPDAYALYRHENGWDPDGYFVSTGMPGDGSLPAFLAEYVPSYGACLAVRNWDGYRVSVKESGHDTGNGVYARRIGWYGAGCSDVIQGTDESDVLRGTYASDLFLVGSDYEDHNLDRIEFTSEADAVSGCVSVPPYTSRDFRAALPFVPGPDSAPGDMGYIRVYMKFTFSADYGRWVCTDYRQAPVSYLSPLYGARALEQEVDGKRVWMSRACWGGRFSWKDATMHTYGEYGPMDVNPELVSAMVPASGQRPVAKPFFPVDRSGMGLAAPVDRFGMRDYERNGGDVNLDAEHANFWSVREHLRPATGAVGYGDIPGLVVDENGERIYSHSGGAMSDPTLWGQFEYPERGMVDYHLPDPEDPGDDRAIRRLVYAEGGGTGDIQVGPRTTVVTKVGAGR